MRRLDDYCGLARSGSRVAQIGKCRGSSDCTPPSLQSTALHPFALAYLLLYEHIDIYLLQIVKDCSLLARYDENLNSSGLGACA